MEMDAARLDEYLESRRSRIGEFVKPELVDGAMVEIREAVCERLPEITDLDSLRSFVNVEALAFAIGPMTGRLRLDSPDRAAFDEILAWKDGFVLAAIRATARAHLVRRGYGHAVDEVAQSAIGAAWERLESWNPERGRFVPWVRGIAENLARGWRPGPVKEVQLDPEPSREIAAKDDSAERRMLENERIANLPEIPLEVFTEMLVLLGECDPWKALAFLFVRFLDWMPARVAAEFAESDLTKMFTRLIEEVRRCYPEIKTPRVLLADIRKSILLADRIPLRDFNTGKETLSDQISEWARNGRSCVFRSGIVQGVKGFLCLVCELSAGAHERVSYLWIRIQLRPRGALFSAAVKPVGEILTIFDTTYAGRDSLSISQIQSCTRKIRAKISEEKTLNDFAGADFYPSLERWLGHIGDLIQPQLTARRLLVYAYIQGHLRPGERR